MEKLLKLSLVLIVVIYCSATAVAKEWNGIVPLVSTKAEVEKLLGNGSPLDDKISEYHFEKSKVTVYYSQGPCTSVGDHAWNVPKNTVVYIVVSPIKKIFLHNLGVTLSEFSRSSGGADLPGTAFYLSTRIGMSMNVEERISPDKHTVTLIHYFPSKDQLELRCKNTVRPQIARSHTEVV